jgi:hypothetical protein
VNAALQGTGTQAQLVLSPASYQYGTITVGATSADATFHPDRRDHDHARRHPPQQQQHRLRQRDTPLTAPAATAHVSALKPVTLI